METANNIHYTESALKKKFGIASPEIKEQVLWAALGYKDLYSSLSRWECVFMCMGYYRTNTVSEGEVLWKQSQAVKPLIPWQDRN